MTIAEMVEIIAVDGVTSHTTLIVRTRDILFMGSASPLAASTGIECVDTGLLIFTMGSLAEKPVTSRNAALPFDVFTNATARLRPRYRDGYSAADGDGYHA